MGPRFGPERTNYELQVSTIRCRVLFPEKLNLAISQHVEVHITEEHINDFLAEYSFTSVVDASLTALDSRQLAKVYLKRIVD